MIAGRNLRFAVRFRDRRPVWHAHSIWMSGEQGEPSRRIRRVQDYVTVRVGAVRSLDELAEVAGLSRYHFARVFREEVGQTPWTYVREARVRHAVDLLERGSTPAEAAHEAGFADQSHLTRTLRAIDGRTPSVVRRKAGAEGGSDIDRKIVQDLAGEDHDPGLRTSQETTWNRISPHRQDFRRSSRTATPSRSGSSRRER